MQRPQISTNGRNDKSPDERRELCAGVEYILDSVILKFLSCLTLLEHALPFQQDFVSVEMTTAQFVKVQSIDGVFRLSELGRFLS